MSSGASTRSASYGVVIHGVKVEGMPKDMEKEGAKALTKANASIHPRVKIDKVEWLTKDSAQKRYASLIARIASAEEANKLIESGVCHESNIKTTQFYDPGCRVHQCLKCQEYGHKIYGCKNNQRCAYCALDHRSELCPHKQVQNMWKCEACRGTHKVFDPRCHKRQAEKERIKRITKTRPIYHAIRERNTFRAISTPIQLGTSTEFSFTAVNGLKRKGTLGRPPKGSRGLSATAAPADTILNRLIKKHRSNEQLDLIREAINPPNNDVSTPTTSTSFSIDDLIMFEGASVSQTKKDTQNEEDDV